MPYASPTSCEDNQPHVSKHASTVRRPVIKYVHKFPRSHKKAGRHSRQSLVCRSATAPSIACFCSLNKYCCLLWQLYTKITSGTLETAATAIMSAGYYQEGRTSQQNGIIIFSFFAQYLWINWNELEMIKVLKELKIIKNTDLLNYLLASN